MVGFKDLLPKIMKFGRIREDVIKSVDSIVGSLKDASNPRIPSSFIDKSDMEDIFENLKDFYDEKYGGFGEFQNFFSKYYFLYSFNHFLKIRMHYV